MTHREQDMLREERILLRRSSHWLEAHAADEKDAETSVTPPAPPPPGDPCPRGPNSWSSYHGTFKIILRGCLAPPQEGLAPSVIFLFDICLMNSFPCVELLLVLVVVVNRTVSFYGEYYLSLPCHVRFHVVVFAVSSSSPIPSF